MQSQIKGSQQVRQQLFHARSALVSRARHALGDYAAGVSQAAARYLVLACALLAASRTQAVTFPINFAGTEQDFDATIDLTGNVFANGAGSVINTKAKLEPFKFTNPLNHPLQLFGGPIAISSDPQSIVPWGTKFEIAGLKLVDINDLDVDLLNGQTADFALDTIFLTTNSTVSLLKSISIDVSGTLSGLRFNQTGPAVTAGIAGSGTFSVQGDLTANVDNLLAVVFGLLQVPVDSQEVTLPGTLNGSWAITNSGPGPWPKILLDGVIDLNIPISLLTNLTTSITDVLSLTISSTIDLAASLTIGVQYHLEAPLIPEPSSIALLGIGLAAVAGVTVHRRRGRR